MPDISRLVIEVDSKGVVTATGNLENFTKASDKAGKGSSGLTKNFGFLGNVANKIPGPIGSIAQGLAGMITPATLAAGAVAATGAAIVKFSKDSIQAFSDFEMIKVNLETVMGSAEQAGSTFNELRDMAARTPFGVEGLANAAVQLKQTGTAASDLIPVLTMLGDTAGGSSEKFNRIVANFAQIQSVGKASSMDLKQFAMAGLPVYEMLQKLGVQGTATAEDISKAFKMMAGEGGAFFGAMARGAETIQGKITNLDDTWKTFMATVAETSGLAELWKQVLDGATTVVGDYTEILAATEQMKQNLVENQEAMSAWASGTANNKQSVIALHFEIEKLAGEYKYIDELLSKMSPDHAMYRDLSNQLIEVSQEWGKLGKQQDEYLKKLNEINEVNKEQEELKRLLDESTQGYRELQGSIEEAYAKTEEGQKEAIENEIKLWQERLKSTRLIQAGYGYSNGRAVRGTIEVGISDEETKRIEAIIKMLQEGLDKAAGQAGKVKHEFADWVELLSSATGYSEENVEQWKGLGTVEKYASEGIEAVRDRFLAATPEGGFIYEALGLNKTDVYQNAADQMKSLVEMMTSARLNDTENWDIEKDASYQRALALLREYKDAAASASYEDAIKELDIRRELIGLAKEEAEIRELTERFGGDIGKARTYYEAKKSVEGGEAYKGDKDELEFRKKLLTLSEEEARIAELTERYGDDRGRAEEIYALEQEIEKVQALNDALNQLKEAGIQLAAGSLVSFANDLGNAFRDGAISGDEFSGAIKNMLRSLIEAMPQLLLNIGLQLLPTNLALGLAFIGASGLMSFVGGLIGDAENDSKANDEMQRLQNIQRQLEDLIDAQRKQQEYYLTQKRKVDSTALSVNDAIITPRGTVYTHPEDYIIATKTPETLMSGGGSNVVVQIINNAGVQVSQQESIGADGAKQIEVTIDKIVQNGIASGRYNGAFNTMNMKNKGRALTN